MCLGARAGCGRGGGQPAGEHFFLGRVRTNKSERDARTPPSSRRDCTPSLSFSLSRAKMNRVSFERFFGKTGVGLSVVELFARCPEKTRQVVETSRAASRVCVSLSSADRPPSDAGLALRRRRLTRHAYERERERALDQGKAASAARAAAAGSADAAQLERERERERDRERDREIGSRVVCVCVCVCVRDPCAGAWSVARVETREAGRGERRRRRVFLALQIDLS